MARGKHIYARGVRDNKYYHIRDNQILAGPIETVQTVIHVWQKGDYLYSQTMDDVWVWQGNSWLPVTGDEADKIRLAMMLLL